ncbi:hypothetical protein HanHA300_Chr12g0435931 [Helianthus annuus]|nr:hypothetical protein HanHA300_Chr12g0435931 [Helianthus annuus]KAJ0492269.1 hypothetical protein HanIR_Chr12g0573011 [Helianthus annuus]KAJ0504552.1 hypothetical protein HanHA89_Chr12g0460581 [Helianthus annuus]
MVIIAFGSEWYNNFTMHGRIQPLPWCYEFSSAVTSELNHRLVMNRGRVLPVGTHMPNVEQNFRLN